MTVIKYIISVSLILFSCNKSTIEANQKSTNKNYRLYQQFCFYNKICTDSMLVSLVINDKKEFMQTKSMRYENRYKVDEVKRISPTKSNDKLVIDQFLQSLEIYNLCASRKKWPLPTPLDNSLFFSEQQFKSVYSTKFNETDFLTIENLGELKNYNFKRKFVEIEKNGKVEILFENNISTKIICNKEFHKTVLFPKYLNFISKNHRLTKNNIIIEK